MPSYHHSHSLIPGFPCRHTFIPIPSSMHSHTSIPPLLFLCPHTCSPLLPFHFPIVVHSKSLYCHYLNPILSFPHSGTTPDFPVSEQDLPEFWESHVEPAVIWPRRTVRQHFHLSPLPLHLTQPFGLRHITLPFYFPRLLDKLLLIILSLSLFLSGNGGKPRNKQIVVCMSMSSENCCNHQLFQTQVNEKTDAKMKLIMAACTAKDEISFLWQLSMIIVKLTFRCKMFLSIFHDQKFGLCVYTSNCYQGTGSLGNSYLGSS